MVSIICIPLIEGTRSFSNVITPNKNMPVYKLIRRAARNQQLQQAGGSRRIGNRRPRWPSRHPYPWWRCRRRRACHPTNRSWPCIEKTEIHSYPDLTNGYYEYAKTGHCFDGYVEFIHVFSIVFDTKFTKWCFSKSSYFPGFNRWNDEKTSCSNMTFFRHSIGWNPRNTKILKNIIL